MHLQRIINFMLGYNTYHNTQLYLGQKQSEVHLLTYATYMSVGSAEFLYKNFLNAF